MSDRRDGIPLASLGVTPEAYRKLEESLWKNYGSRKNFEEVRGMRKQLAEQEKQIEELREQVAELAGENAILLREFTKDRITN
jgi:predicted RNase H-like nuclease (RuvC/YqgF family)